MTKFTVTGNGTESGFDTDCTIGGFLIGVTADTPGNVSLAVLQGININATLYRQGQTPFVICYGNAFALARATSPGSAEGVPNLTAGYTGLTIDLPGCIQLDGNDRITYTVSVGSAIAGQQVSFCSREVTGIETGIPCLTQYNVLANPSSQNIQFGDNVKAITIVEAGADNRVIGINLNSTYVRMDYGVPELAALRASQVYTNGSPATLAWVTNVYAGAELQNVAGNISVDAEVTANAYVVALSYFTNAEILTKAAQTMERVESKLAQKALGA